jgi:hypothetical protein
MANYPDQKQSVEYNIMNSFKSAVMNQTIRTENGMMTRKESADPLVDLFFKIGASRGRDIIPDWIAALVDDPQLATRVLLWARDCRGGAGEREIFKTILRYIESTQGASETLKAIINKIPEIGRFDDVFCLQTEDCLQISFELIKRELNNKNALTSKWCPRKGPIAVALRNYLGLSPKAYRKMLVELTNVTETAMCANKWDEINYSHVPSLCHARNQRAFKRHSPVTYDAYVQSLVKGETTINAGAIYPHDVIKLLSFADSIDRLTSTEITIIVEQWNSLPNFVGSANILPMVDVSGSMTCSVGNNSLLTCLDVALSLGLYCADKNKGEFSDTFLTFSGKSELVHLKGSVVEKYRQMIRSHWDMDTNLHSAFDLILKTAIDGEVPNEEMPEMLLILSDMQFNECVKYDDSAIQMIQRKYVNAGYTLPKVVFWNLHTSKGVPVKFDENGTALISGFSPSILTSVLSADPENFNPRSIMLNTIMSPRYETSLENS